MIEDVALPLSHQSHTVSEAEKSSTCQDRGDSGHLAKTRIPISAHATSSAQALAGIGSSFSVPTTTPKSNLVDQQDGSSFDPVEALQKALYRAIVQTKRGRFIPIDSIDTIVTRENIRACFKVLSISTIDEESWIAKIWGHEHYTNRTGQRLFTSRRKLFAILILSHKASAMESFIQHDIGDKDLPFEFEHDEAGWRYHSDGDKKKGPVRITFMNEWDYGNQDWFSMYQWLTLSPIFDMTDKKVLLHPLRDHIVLPFIHIDPIDEGIDYLANGGYGEVMKVKIHRAHHNWSSTSSNSHQMSDLTRKDNATSSENPSFAVKRLFLSTNAEKTFRHEVEALKRFRSDDCGFLIRLLTTYKYENQYYLVFPWADGNLQQFWKRFNKAEYTLDRITWLCAQCCGIAEALEKIHNNSFQEKALGSAEQKGRHGDIKPENILYFHDPCAESGDELSIQLKISDFGLARWHRDISNQPIYSKPIGVTQTYRAPEHDRKTAISQPSDIWPLGCLYLDFITWYLRGWPAIDEQSELRVHESKFRLVPEDNYFDPYDGSKFDYSLKPCVILVCCQRYNVR